MDYDGAIDFLVQNGTAADDADAILAEMPGAVTYDEYIAYVTRLEDDDIAYLLEYGANGEYSDEPWAEAFQVAIILTGADIDDMTVDDLFTIIPEDSTPVAFARACVLMGAESRADLLEHWG